MWFSHITKMHVFFPICIVLTEFFMLPPVSTNNPCLDGNLWLWWWTFDFSVLGHGGCILKSTFPYPLLCGQIKCTAFWATMFSSVHLVPTRIGLSITFFFCWGSSTQWSFGVCPSLWQKHIFACSLPATCAMGKLRFTGRTMHFTFSGGRYCPMRFFSLASVFSFKPFMCSVAHRNVSRKQKKAASEQFVRAGNCQARTSGFPRWDFTFFGEIGNNNAPRHCPCHYLQRKHHHQMKIRIKMILPPPPKKLSSLENVLYRLSPLNCPHRELSLL